MPLTYRAVIAEEGTYESLQEYLTCLSEDYGVPLDVVRSLCMVCGPMELFDGLVVAVEDASERYVK